jgi:hypothetical protein
MNNEPTNEELSSAWTAAIICFDDLVARSDAMEKLRELRNRRTTFYGVGKTDLMVALDKFISEMNDNEANLTIESTPRANGLSRAAALAPFSERADSVMMEEISKRLDQIRFEIDRLNVEISCMQNDAEGVVYMMSKRHEK